MQLYVTDKCNAKQLIKCEGFLLFSVLYDCKSKVLGFWSQLTDKPLQGHQTAVIMIFSENSELHHSRLMLKSFSSNGLKRLIALKRANNDE